MPGLKNMAQIKWLTRTDDFRTSPKLAGGKNGRIRSETLVLSFNRECLNSAPELVAEGAPGLEEVLEREGNPTWLASKRIFSAVSRPLLGVASRLRSVSRIPSITQA